MSANDEIKKIDAEIAAIQNELKDVHGSETEVYARIVGYYRAVRNWNKGKAEEFKHRKNFVIDEMPGMDAGVATFEDTDSETTAFDVASEMMDDATDSMEITEQSELGGEINGIASYELFARKTCPNCPPVKEYVSGLEITGRVVDVDTDEGLSEAAKKGVFAAPTVIFYDADKNEVSRAHNVRELEEIFSLVHA